MLLLETGKPDDAVDTLLDVLKTDPRDPRALVILGNHYARQHGQPNAALNTTGTWVAPGKCTSSPAQTARVPCPIFDFINERYVL